MFYFIWIDKSKTFWVICIFIVSGIIIAQRILLFQYDDLIKNNIYLVSDKLMKYNECLDKYSKINGRK